MKKSSIIILLAAICLVLSRKKPTKVGKELQPTVDSFIRDAKSFGVDVSTIKDSLDYISVMPLRGDMYGVYTPDNRQVSINYFTLRNKTLLKVIMYHELGHVFGLKHESGGIMETRLSPTTIVMRYGRNITWEYYKIKMFTEIKNLQTKN